MLAVVLACFAAGLAIRRTIPRAVELLPQLDHFVLWVALPALILAKLPQAAVGATVAVPVGVAWTSLGLAWLAVLLLGRAFRWSRPTVGALLMVAAFGNTSFLGLAAVEVLLDADHLAAALAFDQLGTFLALATVGSVIASRYGSAETGTAVVVRRLLTFPPFLALLATIPLRTWALPDDVTDVLGAVGRLVAPVAMLTIGLRFRIELSAHVRSAAAWCLATKMVLLPAVALLAAMVAGVTDDPAWRASVLEAGMPPMVTAGLIATRAGLDEELCTFVVGAGLLLSVVTLPLLRLLLG